MLSLSKDEVGRISELPPALTIRTYEALGVALDRLCARDKSLAAARASLAARHIPLRRQKQGLATLLRLIVYQQISLQAAGAIWSRLQPVATSPAAVVSLGEAGLLQLGLSRPKARYAIAISEAVAGSRFTFDRMARLSDDGARGAAGAPRYRALVRRNLSAVGTWPRGRVPCRRPCAPRSSETRSVAEVSSGQQGIRSAGRELAAASFCRRASALDVLPRRQGVLIISRGALGRKRMKP
jgi:HhH-GPD superfamily base excision DNA repair protein